MGRDHVIREEALTDITLYNSQRNLARTSDGVLHCAYQKRRGVTEFNIYHAYSFDNGLTWNEERVSELMPKGQQILPSIAVDSKDNIHLVWSGWGPFSNAQYIYYREKTSEGWQPQESITDSQHDRIKPSLLWAMWPDPPMVRTDVPETGYASAYINST